MNPAFFVWVEGVQPAEIEPGDYRVFVLPDGSQYRVRVEQLSEPLLLAEPDKLVKVSK